ncbi:hypothetical protein [Mesorhizobium loti]|uniref:hypothetical protein n=1 Tax=Rhizobium loti TaxID=381 RepID=UPI0012BC5EB1|nr:hypothetical protein [Mesorhizobium loti]
MPAGRSSAENRGDFSLPGQSQARRHCVLVKLTDEQMAAAEGWRSAHGISEASEALTELVRLGLLSEIAKIFRLVSDKTPQPVGRFSESTLSVEFDSPTLQKMVQTD